jgi:hypothetical protein
MQAKAFVPTIFPSDVEPIEAFPLTPSIKIEYSKRCLQFIRDIAGRAVSSGDPKEVGYALQELRQTLLDPYTTELIFVIKPADEIDDLLELYQNLEITDLNSRGAL